MHLRLLQAAPAALVHVRGLDTWYRHGADAYVLEQPASTPAGRLIDFLTEGNVEAAVAQVPRPVGVPPVRFEMAVARPNGDVLLCLHRNLRRSHLWSDDGAQIAHGHDEELVLLHFLDGGRRLRLANARSRLARHLADAVASAWFGRPCRYVQNCCWRTRPRCGAWSPRWWRARRPGCGCSGGLLAFDVGVGKSYTGIGVLARA